MCFHCETLSAHHLLFVNLSGNIVGQELRQHCDDILQRLPVEAPVGVIIETGNVSAENCSVDELKQIVLEIGQVGRLPSGYRVAIIAKGDLSYGISRIVRAIALSINLNLQVFRSKVEALVCLLERGGDSSSLSAAGSTCLFERRM